jgi:hypothetical protein
MDGDAQEFEELGRSLMKDRELAEAMEAFDAWWDRQHEMLHPTIVNGELRPAKHRFIQATLLPYRNNQITGERNAYVRAELIRDGKIVHLYYDGKWLQANY